MATIRKRGSKWEAQIRRNGIYACRTFSRQTDAVAWARETEVKAEQQDISANRTRELAAFTLGELVTRYRDTITPKKRGHECEHVVLTAFLRHPLCRKPLSKLTSADFATYRDERLRSVKPSTFNRQINPVRHMFEIAKREWGIPIADNPLDSIVRPGGAVSRDRRLLLGEEERLLTAAQKASVTYLKPIICLAIETAMRRGEILAMTWEDVSLDDRLLHIPRTKNGYPRTIPLSTEAVRVVTDMTVMTDHERLFPITPNAFRLAWSRTVKRAGIVDLHFHDLRHEAVSRLFERRLSMPEVALISGHRDHRMLLRYTHLKPKDLVSKIG